MIEQAIYGTASPGGYQFLARSPGFSEDWLAEAQQLCTGFGERPTGVACDHAIFARPLGKRHVAVVQVADQGRDDAGRPGALSFYLVVLPRTLYGQLEGDPFRIAEHFPPPWRERGILSTLEWTAGPPPWRTVEEIQKVLNVPNSATLLGGVQTLIDGGRLAFERNEPDTPLVRSLWALLPVSNRCELWPASYAFGNGHGFHVVVVPRIAGPDYEGYVFEEQAGDYPEGRYELALQLAAETGNQRDLHALFTRRSRAQTLRLAIYLLLAFMLAPLLMQGLAVLQERRAPPKRPPKAQTAMVLPQLPPVGECPPLEAQERENLAAKLAEVGKPLKLPPPAGTSERELSEALEALDAQLHMTPSRRFPQQESLLLAACGLAGLAGAPGGAAPLLEATALSAAPTGNLRDLGPLQRQVRALLWKRHVPDYDNRQKNTVELIESLQHHIGVSKPTKE